jgi:hypothetical protein
VRFRRIRECKENTNSDWYAARWNPAFQQLAALQVAFECP